MGKTPNELPLLCTAYVFFYYNYYFNVNPYQFKSSGNRPHKHSQCFDFITRLRIIIINIIFSKNIYWTFQVSGVIIKVIIQIISYTVTSITCEDSYQSTHPHSLMSLRSAHMEFGRTFIVPKLRRLSTAHEDVIAI